MKMLILNDLHLSVNRVAGTTQESVTALRAYANQKFRDLLGLAATHECDRVLINGDLTDQYQVPLADALEIYGTLDAFLTLNREITVGASLGNHDVSKDSSKLGTVAFIGALLNMKYGARFHLIDESSQFGEGVYVIPHVANSDVFDLELSKVPEGTRWLAVHSCFDNAFAADKDHSLNLTRKQAKALKERGITVIVGHEHQGRESLGGSVIVVGNQFSQSVSDALGNSTKRCMLIKDSGHEFIQTWCVADDVGGFMRVLWSSLENYDETFQGFVRVEGEATADQAPEVIRAISNFRQKSKAFVVANAVKVETLDDLSDIADSVEDVRSVDVVELLLAELSSEQQVVIRKLIGEQK